MSKNKPSAGGLTVNTKKPSGAMDRFKPDKNKNKKSKGGFGMYWLPLGRRSGGKKDKYYVSHKDDESPKRSIMSSGDSPNAHKDAFDFKEKDHQSGRTSPLPTTSKEAAVQSSSQSATQGTGSLQASVLVDQNKEDDDKELFGSPTLNNSETTKKKEDHDQTLALEELSFDKDKDQNKANGKKNGHFDKVDGVYMSNNVKKEQEDEDLDNCIVKCLYVTMTCCECTIM